VRWSIVSGGFSIGVGVDAVGKSMYPL